jgi:hypothetical protein
MLGLVELAVSPVILAFKAVENIGGALAYSATDLIFGAPSPRFSAQADAVSGSLDATKEFFAHHAPSEVPGLLFDALTAGLDYADEALDRGDAFDAGRGFANFAGGVYLLEKTLEGVHLPKGLEAAPSLRPATAGGPAPAGTASEVSGTSMMGSGEGVPPRLPPRPAPAEPSVPARPPVAKPTEPSPGTPEGTSSGGDVGTIQPKTTAGAAAPGNAGRFADLDAKAVVGDQLTPHHMPQAAAKFTPREHGGALVLPHEEHVLTRTYGAAGRRIVREEIGLSFRDVLARDIRDIRRITGVKYNEGLRLLLEYYRRYFPEVISKPPKSPGP